MAYWPGMEPSRGVQFLTGARVCCRHERVFDWSTVCRIWLMIATLTICTLHEEYLFHLGGRASRDARKRAQLLLWFRQTGQGDRDNHKGFCCPKLDPAPSVIALVKTDLKHAWGKVPQGPIKRGTN